MYRTKCIKIAVSSKLEQYCANCKLRYSKSNQRRESKSDAQMSLLNLFKNNKITIQWLNVLILIINSNIRNKHKILIINTKYYFKNRLASKDFIFLQVYFDDTIHFSVAFKIISFTMKIKILLELCYNTGTDLITLPSKDK